MSRQFISILLLKITNSLSELSNYGKNLTQFSQRFAGRFAALLAARLTEEVRTRNTRSGTRPRRLPSDSRPVLYSREQSRDLASDGAAAR